MDNQNIGGQKVVKSDKCMGVSRLSGGHVPGLPPKSTPMASAIDIKYHGIRKCCYNEVKLGWGHILDSLVVERLNSLLTLGLLCLALLEFGGPVEGSLCK